MQTTLVRPETTRSADRSPEWAAPENIADGISPAMGRKASFSPKANKEFVESLKGSPVFKEYENAFTATTGMPVTLTPVESWQLPHHGHDSENAFCAIMAGKSKSCSTCLQVQQRVTESALEEPETVQCEVGLCDTAVPVRMGESLIGYLHTGQVFLEQPTRQQFEQVRKKVAKWGIKVGEDELQEAFFSGKVVPRKQHDAIVNLLQIFARHLSMVSNQILLQQEKAEPPMITRAKRYIHENYTDELSLGQVAQAVNTSIFYFCKMFKKFTGLNFTDYVSRVRIEKARNLLLNPNLRVSEIAFEVGFQSLTHFNRVFKRIVGQSPTSFRSQLPRSAQG